MEDSITVEEALITEWTTAVEALDSENIRELFDIRPELLWTPLTPLSHLETDFAHFIQRLKEHKLLGTSIRPVYALHHILYDYGVPNDEWAAERNELVEFILKHTNGNELNTCFWGSEQNSVMHLAYFTNQTELIQQLKDHGASSDIPNKSGHLPMIESNTNNSQPEVKLLINKSKSSTLKDRPQNNASDRFKKLRELAESPNATTTTTNKPLTERQNSTRKYFRPGHLEERRRRVLSEEEEAELKRQDSKRQREVEQLAQRSAVRNNPLFKKFEEQQQQQQQAKRVPSISAASAVRERKKLLGAADQIRRTSRVINSLKDRSYVSGSVFRQAQENEAATKKKTIPTLAQLRAGTSAIKEVSPSTSDNEEETENQKKPAATTTATIAEETPIQEKEIIKLNEENNDGVTNAKSNVTSSNVPDSLLEDGDKLTSEPKKDFPTTSNLVDTKTNNTNIGVTESELETLSIGKLGDRGIQQNSKLNDKKKLDISSNKVKDIVNVHEHLNDEEEVEIYTVGKKFAVWKKDEVGQNEDEEGVTHNKKKVPDNKTTTVESNQNNDTTNTSKQLSSPEKGNLLTDKPTRDDPIPTNNGNTKEDVSKNLQTQVSPNENVSQQIRDKSENNELDKKSSTTTQSRSIPVNKQPSAESTTNKVLSTAKKLETSADNVEVKNLKTFGTIKKAASSVTNLKSAFKDEIETNSKDVYNAKSSPKNIPKDSNKLSDISAFSYTSIDEKQVSKQETKIDENSINYHDDNSISLVKQSAIAPEKANTEKDTLATKEIIKNSLSPSQQSQGFSSDSSSYTAETLVEQKDTTPSSSNRGISTFEKSNTNDTSATDKNGDKASYVTETYVNVLASLNEEGPAVSEEFNQSTTFVAEEKESRQIVHDINDNLTINTSDKHSDKFPSLNTPVHKDTSTSINTPAHSEDDSTSSIYYTKNSSLSPSVENETSPIPTATNRSESNQDYFVADKSLKTSTSTATSALNTKGAQTQSSNIPEISFNDDDYAAYEKSDTNSTYQSDHNMNNASTADDPSSLYTDYYKDSSSHLSTSDTQTKKEVNRILHLEINTNKSQMMIEEVDESDEDEASTPTLANPHTYQQQQQQQQQTRRIIEDSDDEEARQEWKSAYDSLLSNQQEMEFEDDILLQHQKTIAKTNHLDDSRLSMSSEMDETSIIQTLSHQNEVRVNNLTSKHEQAKKRQSGSQRSHWSTGIQHVDALKRESLMSKGESVAASSEAGSEQWYDPDDDWNDPQESYNRQSILATNNIGSSALNRPDSEYTADYYYSQQEDESYRHSDSSINTNSETYSNKNSNSTENTNLDDDSEDERKRYQPVIEDEDDDDYYSTNLHAAPTHTITKARGQSSYYNGGQSDNDQDEEGEIVVFMNQFSPPNEDKISNSRGMQSNVSRESEDITTSFFNNSSKPSLVEQHQQNYHPKPLTATTTTNFSSSTLSVNNIRGREDDEVSLIKIPSRTVAIAEAGVEQEVLPHDPNNPRVEDISHYMNKLPAFDRNNGIEGPVHGGSAFDAAAMSGSSVGGPRMENESVVIKRAISTTHSDGQPLELNRGIPHAHEIDSAFLMAEKRRVSNEDSQKISMSSMEANAFGKMYIAVSGAHNMLLPLPKEITYVRCVISDGEYEYMSRYEILGHQILMDYECVIDTRPGMIITVSLHVRPDYHVKPRTGWTKWFTSIRKQKEHLSGYVHPEDGAIGQTRFAVDHMVPGCYKKTYEASFDCFNSWYARTTRERNRREQFGDEEDFLKIVGKLNVEMLYLPVSNPSVQVPRSLRECDLTIKIRQWHDTCWQSGYLSTRRQGLKVWERHYYRLIGSQLIGYTSDGSDRQVWDHYNISDVIRLSAAADKVIVTLMEDENDDKVFGTETIHEANHKGFFRLAFADYNLDCVSDDLEESEAWVKTLKSMIGRIPLRIHFSD